MVAHAPLPDPSSTIEEPCSLCDGTGAWSQSPCMEFVFPPTCAHHRYEIAATFDPLVLYFGAAAGLLFALRLLIG